MFIFFCLFVRLFGVKRRSIEIEIERDNIYEMAQIREPSQDQFKSLKLIVSPAEKNGDIMINSYSILMKLTLSIAILASIALFLYTNAFSNQSHWFKCTECHSIIRNSQTLIIPTHHHHRLNTDDDQEEKNKITHISHILFGIGGSTKTWKKRKHYSELWWKPGVTRGFVWLDKEPGKDPWPETSPPYRVSSDISSFNDEHRTAIRIARIVLESFRLGYENVRWFVMGDDDTVFFTENLVTVLSKYDHRQMYYIGGNSESVDQDLRHSYQMAYGGGGFAISYALAVELVKLLDGCLERYTYVYGSDERIKACVAEIGVPITKELGFHQFDIRGDPYGLLAAHPVAPLVSLHHLDYMSPLYRNKTRVDSLKMLFGAYNMDPGRIVQQSFCYDMDRQWSVSVSWGYTVQIYPSLLPATELWTPLQTFHTWGWRKFPFTFNTRTVKPDPCERPLVYILDRVVESGGRDGEGTVSTYKAVLSKRREKDCDKPEYVPLAVHKVNVSASKMVWEKEAPRRQCCEIRKGLNEDGGVLQISIRSCYPGESVTPH